MGYEEVSTLFTRSQIQNYHRPHTTEMVINVFKVATLKYSSWEVKYGRVVLRSEILTKGNRMQCRRYFQNGNIY